MATSGGWGPLLEYEVIAWKGINKPNPMKIRLRFEIIQGLKIIIKILNTYWELYNMVGTLLSAVNA